MKSRIYKGLTVKSELKPKIGIAHKDFVYTRGASLAEKFAAIRERLAAEKTVDNVTRMPARKVK